MAFALHLLLLLCGITGSWSFVIYRGQSCPQNWTQLNERCFISLEENLRFADAESFCNGLGGNLASIHSELENEVVRQVILEQAGNFQRSWIGFNDAVQEGVFVWTDGSTVDFTDWANNRPRTNDNLNCAEINFRDEFWNDVGCRARRAFVCATDLGY
ncbi:galactose-specific lectin nattectin-like [Dunckerocampus dactyliophorus]|uniref:galactose-specific lectin nattectin-like n=1 Tax=Dunckerocampus dactyliophorus TaxID=161453 RepID=UPI00240588C5|nr:galactose-specific lectin nattectin-like [Dunckerocampus dactyliophorus]